MMLCSPLYINVFLYILLGTAMATLLDAYAATLGVGPLAQFNAKTQRQKDIWKEV